MPTVDEELLTTEGITEAYEALTGKYRWFIHMKPTRKFGLIRSGGLQPRSQGGALNPGVAAAIGHVVPNVNELICFRPYGANVHDSTPWRDEKMFVIAVSGADLPKIVTVDWTMGGTWGFASIIKSGAPDSPNGEIFCEVVRRRGSVAVYETVPADALRVLTTGSPDAEPERWPSILNVELADLAIFG